GTIFFFFFQAEDGIRDRNVTGVQTCALPILTRAQNQVRNRGQLKLDATSYYLLAAKYVTFFTRNLFCPADLRHFECTCTAHYSRSEERRVGKECSCALAPCE